MRWSDGISYDKRNHAAALSEGSADNAGVESVEEVENVGTALGSPGVGISEGCCVGSSVSASAEEFGVGHVKGGVGRNDGDGDSTLMGLSEGSSADLRVGGFKGHVVGANVGSRVGLYVGLYEG